MEGEGKRCGACIDTRMRDLKDDVLYLMETRKVYLDTHVSLVGLSAMLLTNTTYLSRVINDSFGCNLKTFLNRYRIDHAKRLLCEDRCDMRLLPSHCGFISRSTFYAAFAKYVGMSPTEYRTHMHSLQLRVGEAASPPSYVWPK